MYSRDNYQRVVAVETAFSLNDALKFYGVAAQGHLGDNPNPEPPLYDVERNILWNAWDKERGKPQDEARKEFLDIAYADLKKRGIPPAVDKLKIEKDKEYIECL